jgi:hypothetical protein
MEHYLTSIISKQMYDEVPEIVEQEFERQANQKGLTLANASKVVEFRLYVPGDENDPEDYGTSYDCTEDQATLVQIHYGWF